MRRLLVVVLLLSVTAAFAQTGENQPAKPKVHLKPMAAKSRMAGEITVKTVAAMTAATVMEKAADYVPKDGYTAGMDGAMQAWSAMLPDGYNKLGAWMKAGGKPIGPSFAIYFEDPSKTAAKDLTCKVGFPTTKDAKGTDAVKIEELPETQAAVTHYTGPYDGMGETYNALMKWIPDHGYEIAGPPTEVYLKSEHDKVKSADYLTEIHFPVKKAEAAKPAEAPKPAGDKK